MTQLTHDIHTTHDLRDALAGVPDSRRVVIMRDGVLVPCEVTWRECGDWCVLEIVECEREVVNE